MKIFDIILQYCEKQKHVKKVVDIINVNKTYSWIAQFKDLSNLSPQNVANHPNNDSLLWVDVGICWVMALNCYIQLYSAISNIN